MNLEMGVLLLSLVVIGWGVHDVSKFSDTSQAGKAWFAFVAGIVGFFAMLGRLGGVL